MFNKKKRFEDWGDSGQSNVVMTKINRFSECLLNLFLNSSRKHVKRVVGPDKKTDQDIF